MKLKDFKLRKNRQRPDLCFLYEKKVYDYKFSIFTMDGGNTFLVSIEKKEWNGKYYKEFKQRFQSIDEALEAINIKIQELDVKE